MHPFHRIGSREGETPGQHFVERHTEGIEVASRIDRTIHPPGLFRRHVGERSGDELGRFGRLALARKPRSDTKAHQPALAGGGVYQNIGRLDVLVDDAALMQVTDSVRQINRNTQTER